MTMEAKWEKDHYEPIYFTKDNFGDIDREHDDPMVISTLIHNFLVKWILVNQGSSIDILYSHAVEALGLKKSTYNAYITALLGFIGGQVQVDGAVRLQLTVGTQPSVKIMKIDFLVVST